MLLNYKILFIEDDNKTRQNYVNVLKSSFRDVYQAKDGFEALEIYKAKKPDIMIIDVDLPKMSGLDLLKKIRKEDINTKAILFTSYSDKKTLLKATILKLTEYLIKPVSRKELKIAIQLAIDEIENYKITSSDILKLKDSFTWSFEKEELYKCNKLIKLTKKEKDILNIIFRNTLKNKATSYEELLYPIWEDYNELTLKSLKTFMSTIRKKLPENTIVNEYSIGYKIG